MGRDKDSTIPFEQILRGSNDLFAQAVAALGGANAMLLRDTLRALGSSPERVTPDEIGMALPEIERRVRMLMRPDAAGAAMARLRTLLLHWDG